MAEDAAGLLRELDLAPAHVIGASMGGMIAQTLAARHPELVRSLVSIMSTTGRADAAASPRCGMYGLFLRRPPIGPRGVRGADGEGLHRDRLAGVPARPGGDPDARDARATNATATRTAPGVSWRRSSPRATAPSSCTAITAPTLVIHGSADRLVGPSGRSGDRARDPRREADDGQGHGPRPAAGDLAAADRRDRPARARRADGTAESRPPLQAPPPSVPGL